MNSLPDDLGPRLRDSLNHGTVPELSNDLVTGAPNRTAPKLTNPRRRIQLAGGATVLVAALAVAALVVAPGLSSAPLFTAAASARTDGAASASEPASGLMRIWAEYHYHAGAGLSTSGGNGHVYQLSRVGSGSKRAAELAADFGLSGQSAKRDQTDAANPTWTIGSTDGTKPTLEVSWSGTGDWWYSDPAANPGFACSSTGGASSGSGGSTTGSAGGIPPANGGAPTAPDCASNTPNGPNKAPTGRNARSLAQKLFASTGFTVAASDIQLTSDAFQTTATSNLVVEGVPTALDWGITWSNTGAIASAYGHSVSVIDRGSHGTISAADAVARLSDSRWSGSAGPKYQGGIRMYAANGAGTGTVSSTVPVSGPVASPPATEPTATPTGAPTDTPTEQPTAGPAPQPTAGPTDAPTDAPTEAPTPGQVPTGPPIIDVTITKAAPTLLVMWDSKGGAWLVPGYAMQVENDAWNSVVSLVPGVIELPPVPTVEPDLVAPSVGAPGGTDGSSPVTP